MDTINIIKDRDGNDFVIIFHNDGSETGMSKATYDAQQAASTLPSNSSTPASDTLTNTNAEATTEATE